MKQKRMLSMVMAIVMVLTMMLPMAALATDDVFTDVVITKVGLESLDGWPKGGGNDSYTGAQITDMGTYFGTHTVMKGVAFRVYKGSDATAVSPANEVAGGPFLTDANGQVRIANLPKGTYYFIEDKAASTYVGPNGEVLNDARAVPFTLTLPMVKSDGTLFGTGDKALYVYPKNTDEKPVIDKNFADANTTAGTGAQYPNYQAPKETRDSYKVGDVVPYEVKTKIPAKSAYQTLVWSDVMTDGLTYNKDLVLTPAEYVKVTDYTLTETDSGFVLEFTKTGLDKLTAAAANGEVEFVLKYTATINENAMVEIPDTNSIVLQYGNAPKVGNTPIPVKPKEGKITVTKSWDDGKWAPGESAVIELINANTGEVVGKVTLTIDNPTHTFTGLDPKYEYKVVEKSINGYSPEYTSTGEGQLAIENKKDNNPEPLVPTTPKVVTYGAKFHKYDAKENNPLAGAEFIVTKKGVTPAEYLALKDTTQQAAEIAVYNAAQEAYLKAIADLEAELKKPEGERNAALVTKLQDDASVAGSIKNLEAIRNEKYVALNMQWTWVTEKDKAFKFVSGTDGNFVVTGLAKGNYQLIEITPPAGYASLTNPIDFSAGPGTFDDAKTIKIANNKVTIPQTGGIGSIIFVVAGLAIMTTAVVAMKKRRIED